MFIQSLLRDRPLLGIQLPRPVFDPNTPPAPPAPPAPTPTPTPAPIPPPAPAPPPAPNETPEQARIRELNHESMTHRHAWRAATAELTETRGQLAAAQGQTEQVRREAEQRVQTSQSLVDKYKAAAINSAVAAAAATAGVIDPDVVGLIPRAGITIDDNGNVSGVDAAVTGFKTAKPAFFRGSASPSPSPSPTPGPSPSLVPNASPTPGPVPPSATAVNTLDKKAYGDAKTSALRSLRGR